MIRIPFNSTTPSPFYFPFVHLLPVCSFKNRANRPPASRLKRPSVHFRLEFERISGLGTRLGDFSSGKKGAIELYLDACRSIDFFLGGEGEGVARVCRVQRFYPALSTDPSLIVRFNSGFDHRFYSAFLPVKVSRSSDSSETPLRHAYACENCFRPFDLSFEHRNALNCFWEGDNFLPSCKWMHINVEIGTLESFCRQFNSFEKKYLKVSYICNIPGTFFFVRDKKISKNKTRSLRI